MRGFGVPTPDAELVEAVLRGDHDAFTALYRGHVGAVHVVVRDHLHDREEIADAVQDTFARALERLSTLRDLERFRPWLLSIARHSAIDRRRATRRRPVVAVDDTEEVAARGPGPGELVELSELAELVNGCVGGLSARDATAITLVTRFGLRPPEVATALGVSVGAAKVLLHRARRRLRDALALEVMVRARTRPCDGLVGLLDLEDLTGAAAHVHRCPVCGDAVTSELELYSASHKPSMRT